MPMRRGRPMIRSNGLTVSGANEAPRTIMVPSMARPGNVAAIVSASGAMASTRSTPPPHSFSASAGFDFLTLMNRSAPSRCASGSLSALVESTATRPPMALAKSTAFALFDLDAAASLPDDCCFHGCLPMHSSARRFLDLDPASVSLID